MLYSFGVRSIPPCGDCHDDGTCAMNCGHAQTHNEKQPRFPIGTKYKTAGKHPVSCTVTDILKTYNSNNELIRIRYIATHDFCGQSVIDHDVCETTIARGAI